MKYLSKFLHHLLDKPVMIVVYLLLIDVGIFVYSYNFAYDFLIQWGVKHVWGFIILGIVGFVWHVMSTGEEHSGSYEYYEYYEDDDMYMDKGSQSLYEAERRIHEEGYAPDMGNGYDRSVVFDDEMARLKSYGDND